MLHHRIYLDHAATTPLHPAAAEAMQPWLSEEFGNPSSLYEEGRRARHAIDEAREVLSSALGCLFAEVLFTSSGTEAANMAIVGAALSNTDARRNRILFSAAEHHCVLNLQPLLSRLGYKVELVPVDRRAVIDLNALQSTLYDDVLLVSCMHANNEFGTIQPVRRVVDMAHARGALVHCDAVQTFLSGWQVADLDADLVTIAAHKVNGPKGVGAIYTRAGVILKPLVYGGGQEREMRAGTENVAGVVGFAAAVKALREDGRRDARDRFVSILNDAHLERLHCTVLPGDDVLGGHAHLRLEGVSAESMLILLDRMGVSASSGAACSSGSLEPSHVMMAAGYSEDEAKQGLRFTFGYGSTLEDAQEGASRVLAAADRIVSTK